MKNSNACPKCESDDILRLTDHSHSTLVPTNWTVLGAIYMTRFLCANCGYTEEWIESPADREQLRNRHNAA